MKTNLLLLVEDNQNDVLLLLRKLDGYEVATATSLHAATDFLKSTTPDAILLDLSLPDSQSNAKTLEAIKAVRGTAAIIIISGNGDPEVIRHSILNTASGYLVKGRTDGKERIEAEITKSIANHSACVRIREATKEIQSK